MAGVDLLCDWLSLTLNNIQVYWPRCSHTGWKETTKFIRLCEDNLVSVMLLAQTTFQGRFVVRRLGLATINLHTKCEVSMFTHYEDMKGDEKCKNWGSFGG